MPELLRRMFVIVQFILSHKRYKIRPEKGNMLKVKGAGNECKLSTI